MSIQSQAKPLCKLDGTLREIFIYSQSGFNAGINAMGSRDDCDSEHLKPIFANGMPIDLGQSYTTTGIQAAIKAINTGATSINPQIDKIIKQAMNRYLDTMDDFVGCYGVPK